MTELAFLIECRTVMGLNGTLFFDLVVVVLFSTSSGMVMMGVTGCGLRLRLRFASFLSMMMPRMMVEAILVWTNPV